MPRSAGPHRLRISGGDFQQKHSQNLVIGGSSEPLASCARPYVSRLVKKAGQSVPLSFSSPSASRSMTVEASLEAHWSLQLAREVEVGRPARPISKLKPRCMSFQTAYSQSCCGRPQLCADNPRSGLAAHSKILASPPLKIRVLRLEPRTRPSLTYREPLRFETMPSGFIQHA